jgi:hypothetical protein
VVVLRAETRRLASALATEAPEATLKELWAIWVAMVLSAAVATFPNALPQSLTPFLAK